MEEELTSKLIRGRRSHSELLFHSQKIISPPIRTISVSKHSSNHLNVNSIPLHVTDPVDWQT